MISVLGSLALVGLWLLYLAPSTLGGPVSLVWVSGTSMEPTLHTGDLSILYRQHHYEVGDVVAFDIPEGGVVIHRIVRVEPGGYQFRGDNRDSDDPWTLDEGPIRGRQLLAVPRAAELMGVLGQPAVMAGMVVVLIVLVRLNRGGPGPEPEPEPELDPGSGVLGGRRSAPAELVEPVVVDTEMVGQFVHHRDQDLVPQGREVGSVLAQGVPVEGDPVR